MVLYTIATALLLLFTTSVPAFAQWGNYGGWRMGPGMMGSWGMGWGMGWPGMIFMWIFWLLLIVGVIFLIKWLVQSTRGSHPDRSGDNRATALDILAQRYARGEIDREEFEQKKKDLRS